MYLRFFKLYEGLECKLRCNNNKDNEVTVTLTPVATEDIEVTETQDMDQTNTCDDDDLGIPD